MKRIFAFPATAIACLLVTIATGACTRLEVESNPDTFPVPESAASGLRVDAGSIAIKNAYPEPTVVQVSEAGAGVDADLQQYTETAMTLLERALEKRGIEVAPSAGKTVTLKVTNIVYTYGWTIGYGLNLIADLGNGQRAVVNASNNSPATAWRAIDGALMRAVTKLLLDESFQRYVNE